MIAPNDSSSSSESRTAEEIQCIHCQLPVPAALVQKEEEKQFCCQGCRTAYSVIHGCGLSDYYSMRDRIGGDAQAINSSGNDYEEFDDPGFQEQYVRFAEEKIGEVSLYLQGIHCAACVWLLEKLPEILPGIIEARVNLTRSTISIRWMADKKKLSEIGIVLEQLGYPAHPLSSQGKQAGQLLQNRREWTRIAVAGACAGNAMIIAVALYAGLFSTMAPEHKTFFRYTSAIIGAVCLFWPGSVFFYGAFNAIRTRTPHMDLPVALGLGVGGVVGAINTIAGVGEIYFDSLCLLIFFLLIGRHLQLSQQRQAADRVSLMRSLVPRSAYLVENGSLRKVLAETLKPGDLIEVKASELIPADGILVEGTSAVDQSLLTGETEPIPIQEKDAVTAGATNLLRTIRVAVSATGEMSRLGKIMHLVETATIEKSPVVQLANRIGGYFVVTVIILAMITAGVWASSGMLVAMDHSVALLIVACPCALGLATPLAIAMAQAQAARFSILIKQGDTLERLAEPGMLWLDKTGTITEPGMSVQTFYCSEEIPEPFRRDLYELEKQVLHPVSKAIVDYLTNQFEEEITSSEVNSDQKIDLEYVQGAGIIGCIEARNYRIGSKEFILQTASWNTEFEEVEKSILSKNESPVFVAINDQLVACFGLANAIRHEVFDLIQNIKQLGWTPGILSGDHQQVVSFVADSIGISSQHAFGELSPEQKLEIVQQESSGTTVMIGDGVNDSAALAAADVGIAVHGGAEVSLQAADIYLGQDGLKSLWILMIGARRTLHLIQRNFIISLSYNLIAVALAMAGMISPLIAAILMPISSLSVIGISLSARLFGTPK